MDLSSEMNIQLKSVYIADAAGLVALAAFMALAAFFVPSSQVPIVAWLFAYPAGAASSLFIWHHPKAPTTPGKWLLAAAASIVAAPIWFGFAALGASIMFTDEPTASKVFDLIMALIISPGFTVVAFLGGFRALILQRTLP